MRFLIDRSAGHRIAIELVDRVMTSPRSGPRGEDPGDSVILDWAVAEDRIVVTVDMDFGELVFREGRPHRGLLRLPDVPSAERIALFEKVIAEHGSALQQGAIVTAQRGRIRISRRP